MGVQASMSATAVEQRCNNFKHLTEQLKKFQLFLHDSKGQNVSVNDLHVRVRSTAGYGLSLWQEGARDGSAGCLSRSLVQRFANALAAVSAS
jgi:hypothetical protein